MGSDVRSWGGGWMVGGGGVCCVCDWVVDEMCGGGVFLYGVDIWGIVGGFKVVEWEVWMGKDRDIIV